MAFSATLDYKITDATPGEVFSGIAPSALASKPAGTLVRTANPGNTVASIMSDSVNLELCDGFGPVAVLERDILAVGASIPLDQLMFQDSILCPVPVGSAVSARQVKFIEVEGSDLIQTTGGQALAGNTAVGTPLTALGGKWALQTHTATQEVVGILRAQLAPVNSGNFRLWIEVLNQPVTGVAS